MNNRRRIISSPVPKPAISIVEAKQGKSDVIPDDDSTLTNYPDLNDTKQYYQAVEPPKVESNFEPNYENLYKLVYDFIYKAYMKDTIIIRNKMFVLDNITLTNCLLNLIGPNHDISIVADLNDLDIKCCGMTTSSKNPTPLSKIHIDGQDFNITYNYEYNIMKNTLHINPDYVKVSPED